MSKRNKQEELLKDIEEKQYERMLSINQKEVKESIIEGIEALTACDMFILVAKVGSEFRVHQAGRKETIHNLMFEMLFSSLNNFVPYKRKQIIVQLKKYLDDLLCKIPNDTNPCNSNIP